MSQEKSPSSSQPPVLPSVQDQMDSQSLVDNLRELRTCLLYSAAAIFIGFAVAYSQIKIIGQWFFRPLLLVLPPESSLIFTSYQEGFFFI